MRERSISRVEKWKVINLVFFTKCLMVKLIVGSCLVKLYHSVYLLLYSCEIANSSTLSVR